MLEAWVTFKVLWGAKPYLAPKYAHGGPDPWTPHKTVNVSKPIQ